MCANSFLDVAFGACCTGGESYATPFCRFDIERTSYQTAQTRCTSEVLGGNTCNWAGINLWSPECSSHQLEENWHWTDQDCTMKVKGKIFISISIFFCEVNTNRPVSYCSHSFGRNSERRRDGCHCS